jgi:hypothetical protein
MSSGFIRRREAENMAVEVHVTRRKGVAFFRSHGRPLVQRYDQSGDPYYAAVSSEEVDVVPRTCHPGAIREQKQLS